MTHISCPKCNSPMRLRNGRYGEFYGCSTYPKCKGTRNIASANSQTIKAQVKTKPTREFKASKYQAKVFGFISNGKGNAVVEAVAGSGKTITIVKALDLTPKNANVVFCAFNKHIADELAARSPAHVRVATLHSLGFAALRSILRHRPHVDDRKLWNIVKEVLPEEEDRPLHAPLQKLVSLAKATLVDRHDPIAVLDMAEHYGIELNGDAPKLLALAPRVLTICQERLATIDFDDMIWLPIVLNVHIDTYDWVFVDECQDLNKVQIEMVLRMVKDTGRVVAVGDRRQSIYGFRGADVNAVPNLIESLKAVTLPLSITYRCPKSHVELARELEPTIEAAEWAKDGVVRHEHYDLALSQFSDSDLILCRVNAPLVKVCYNLIRRGQKAVIRGRDIGKALQNFIDRLKPTDICDLLMKVDNYCIRETRRLEAKGHEGRIQALHDKCDTLEALCDGVSDLSELRYNIAQIFDDHTKIGVILSSVHRAKGDESDKVWILHPELMPHPLAKKDWQVVQEFNIKYVAMTRSKSELVFVDGGK